MTREDIIRMAQECDLIGARPHLDGIYVKSVEHFAALVAAAEREACANECEHTALRMGSEWMAHHCAAAIRARGQA